MSATEEIYVPENVPIFEAMYGKGLISLGGVEAVERMFDGQDLVHQHLLDIGFGIGGVPHFLVQNYDCQVSGVEVHGWMADYGHQHAPLGCRDRLDLRIYEEEGKLPFESGTIDLVYSKGVLTNIADKASLLNEIVRVLKQDNGRICLIDWVKGSAAKSGADTLATGEQSHKETVQSYQDMLEKVGFHEIDIEDNTAEYREYVVQLEERLASEEHRKQYQDVISDELRQLLIHANSELLENIDLKHQASVRILARTVC